MFTIPVKDRTGKEVGSFEIEKSLLGSEVKVELIHQACLMYEANRRVGTACAKTRAEVAGSRIKMFRQKGTGRARRGFRQAATLVGGGVTHGPRPRDYSYDIGKKSRFNAMKSALLSKFVDSEVMVIDDLSIEKPKTKEAVETLTNIGAMGKVLVVTKLYPKKEEASAQKNENVYKSFRNVPGVKLVCEKDLNAYEIMRGGKLLFTKEAIETLKGRL